MVQPTTTIGGSGNGRAGPGGEQNIVLRVAGDKDRLVAEIDETRGDMTATVIAIEERLSPAHLKSQLLEQFRETKQIIKQDLKDEWKEAKTLIAQELKTQMEDAQTKVAAEVKEQIENAKGVVKVQFGEAKEALKLELHDAKSALRDATIGRVETMVTNAKNTVKGASATVLDTLWRNPIPTAITGIGLTWLIMNARASHRSRRMMEGSTGALAHKVEDSARQVKDATAHLAHKTKNAVGDLAHAVKDTVGDLADGAKRVEQRFENSIDENPLAYGAIALALGTVVGVSLPRSKIEDEYLGGVSDQFIEKAEGIAHEAIARIQAPDSGLVRESARSASASCASGNLA